MIFMNKFMAEALKESLLGVDKKDGGPFGAIIVCKGKIIARAHNMVYKTNDPTAHAEITAIRKATKKIKNKKLTDCELYTTCEPCPMCFAAIHWARIKKVYYSASRKDAAKIGFDDKEIYDILSGKEKEKQFTKKQIDKNECLIAFKEWENKKGKLY